MLISARQPAPVSSESAFGRAKLIAVILVLAVAGVALASIAGPPRFPSQGIEMTDVGRVLGGSDVPWQLVAAVLVDAAWLIWIWAIASLVLDVLVLIAEIFAGGAAWVRWLRAAIDRCTLPVVRRAVAGACAVELFAHSLSVVHAAPLPSTETHIARTVVAESPNSLARANAPSSEAAALPDRLYAVQPGDTLWSIAAREYGAGAAYRRIIDANVGRQMPNGSRFTARGVIQPGWSLVLPDLPALTETADGHLWYTVQQGDSLSLIAATMLGDAEEWKTIFQLNRGALARDGRTLDDADLIWPGLKLQLPDAPDASPQPIAPPLPPAPTDDQVDVPADDFTAARSEVITAIAPADALAAAASDADVPVPNLTLTSDSQTPIPAEQSAPDQSWAPLVRTVHATDPIALDALDAAETETPADVTPSDGDGGVPTAPWNGGLPLVPLASGAAAGLAAVGALAFAHHRRKLRRLRSTPETEVVVESGFATADLTTAVAHRADDLAHDPLTATACRVMAFLDEYNLSDSVACVSVMHGRSGTTLALATTLASQPLVLDLVPALAVDLGREIEASVSGDGDLIVHVGHSGKMRPLAPATADQRHAPVLIPVGVLYDRRIVAAAWGTFGHALVSSSPGQGAETILTSLIAAITARHAPVDLRLWCIGRSHALTAPIFTLPHVERRVDAENSLAVSAALEELRALVARRDDESPSQVVVVLPELAGLDDISAELSLILPRDPTAHVRILAATGLPERIIDNPLTDHLTTRFVLRTADEETSVALLGVADAAYLGGGGRMLMRLDNRAAVELYGYQVTPEHLTRLMRVMRSAFAERQRVSGCVPQPQVAPTQSETDAASLGPHLSGSAAIQTDDVTPDAAGAEAAPKAVAPRADQAVEQVTVARPAIEVTCFGNPRVMCAGRQVWPNPEVGEAKPWELLLFVATRPPEGVSTSDAVEALWPDDVGDNASQRFRQLRYRLRLALSSVLEAPGRDGIVLSRGVLRLDRQTVYSDAAEFLDLIQRGRSGGVAIENAHLFERARTLYVGDLLDGPEARRYGWLEDRDGSGVTLREHFRKLYMTASARLAEIYATESERYEAARDLYRELTELDPGDERLWRALFRLHADRGDRPALVREERRMRELLRELAAESDSGTPDELEEPTRELSDEYHRLLERLRTADRHALSV